MDLNEENDTYPLYPKLKRQSNGIKLLWLLLAIGIVLSVGSFVVLNFKGSDPSDFHRRHLEIDSEIYSEILDFCSGIPDSEKFDCFPDYPVTEQACLDRGCCYHVVTNISINPLNIPFCYYPNNYKGYSIVSTTRDDRHITAKLKRGVPSGFPRDVSDLLLVITMVDEVTVRIKVTDVNSSRFEVPIKIDETLGYFNDSHYEVGLDPHSCLFVTRKKTGKTILRINLSQLVYSDQFIQFSSYLPSPYMYGIGESYGPMLRSVNWTRITLFNSDQEPIPHHPLYGSQPFYLSLESGGSANGFFLFNSNAMDVILQPTPAITFRPIGGILDMFVFLGPTPEEVVRQYTKIVGRPAIPPYWSLGFHLCRFGYNSLNKTKETLQRNIDAGIPIDVQWNDIDYMDEYKDFTYDKVKFAGLPEFVDDLHSKGMHYVIMTDPGISNSEAPGTYPPYDEGALQDLFMKNPNGTFFVGKVWTNGTTVFPDFSNPKTMSYWIEQFENFHKEVEYDGVWIDMNEPSNFVNGGIDGCIESSYEDPPYLPGSGENKLRHKTACMTAQHYDDIHYYEHNLLGYREAHATYMALRFVRGKRPFIISRATFAGQGNYSGHWSGDIASTWEDMRYTIPSMINFNMYGIPMIGSDICGFNKNTSVELCARWQALGAFYPFSRNHNERVTIEQDPVALGPIVVEATKRALEARYNLLPYLYNLFFHSHAHGETMVRPLFFEFPQDKNTYALDEQFMLGPAVMIVPALYPNVSSVTAYLPKGYWYYGSYPKLINSKGANYTFDCDILSIVSLARGGYIVPLQLGGKTTTESRKNDFTLIVPFNENKEAYGELYWDDGESIEAYESGDFNLIQFNASKNMLSSEAVVSNFGGKMSLSSIELVGLDSSPSTVTVNGVQCLQKAHENEKEMPSGKLIWFPIYTRIYVPDENFCNYYVIASSPITVVIVMNPLSLLTLINVRWS